MLRKLKLSNFTAFSKADLKFSKEINVIIGANGTGKSHLLKLIYTICSAKHEEGLANRKTPFKGEDWIGDKLTEVFNIERVGRLVRRKQGRNTCQIATQFYTRKTSTSFALSTNAKYKVKDITSTTLGNIKPSIYIPPKEIISIYPGLAQAIADRELSFDDTYYDLCWHLSRKPLRGKRLAKIADILNPIEQQMLDGGTFYEDGGEFYYSKPSLGNLEASLVAEGLCKIGVLAHLLRNGSLVKQGSLLWDEPESNLNPQLIRLVANTIVNLAKNNIQVIIATHSLFLIRELDIISRKKQAKVKFVGLNESKDGVDISQGDDIECIDNLQSLEAELDQSDRYLALEFDDE